MDSSKNQDNGRSVRVAQIHDDLAAARRRLDAAQDMRPSFYAMELINRAAADVDRLARKLSEGSL
jgi:hypothetical protein